MKRDIEAVITSYNQGTMILEAVRSVCSQTLLPERIIIVDDGSTDKESLAVLGEMKNSPDFPVPVIIQFQENQGVSAARNTGIRSAHSSMVLVLDGDDRIEKEYIEKVYHLLLEHPSMVIASSWMRTFGTLDAIVRPSGGNIVPFLSHGKGSGTKRICNRFHEESVVWGRGNGCGCPNRICPETYQLTERES